ncbi:MAG: hypothetical protein U0269_01520 [Polyangiales bacterium]
MRSRSQSVSTLLGGCIVASSLAHCAMATEPTRPDASRSDARGGTEASVEQDSGGAFDAGVVMRDDVVVVRDVTVSDGSCPLGLLACGASCINPAVDPLNCGSCGNRCPAGANGVAICESGTCDALCQMGFGNCDRNTANGCEVDVRTSATHCGMCGRACALPNATAGCSAGSCVIAMCNAGFGDCDAMAANGCETPLNSVSNCGMCGRSCSGASPICDTRAGMCSSGCVGGQTRCGMSCVDTGSDVTNCGACGRACSVSNGSARCEASMCGVLACNAGFANCDGNAANGCEVNTRTDVNNCGGCGNRPMEVCNNVDDNCDGVVDEGYRAEGVNSTYTALSALHDGCTQVTRFGPACNAAISRFCAARGCTSSGFGPVENSDDAANVVCTKGEVVVTAYSTLARSHAPCDGVGERFGPNCNAAIHRFCASRGAVSGHGPIENSGDTAVIQCVFAPSAQVVMTTYGTLATFHAPCDGAGERFGPNCNAAINRFCASRGAVGGYGPVENDGANAYVVCLTR